MSAHLSVADFIATRWGSGLSEAEASVYVAEANSVVEALVNVDMIEYVSDAPAKCRAAAIIVANHARKNFDGMSSVSIGGKVSVGWQNNAELVARVKSALGILADSADVPTDPSFGEITR